jgi:DNA repair protein RecO (recombination protein O)
MKYRDSAKLLTVYTQEFGRCSLIANGARTAKNKFGSTLEPMSCSILTFYKKQNKDLHTLSSAESALRLRNIMESFDRMTAGLAMCEIVYASQTHEEKNLPLYNLLKSSLAALNDSEQNEQSLVFWFQIHYAALLGFALNPTTCPVSGEEVRPNAAKEFVVSLADGAPYSLAFARINSGFRMFPSALSALQTLVETPLNKASNLTFSTHVQSQLSDFFSLYYQFHLDRTLTDRTRRFMQSVVAQ